MSNDPNVDSTYDGTDPHISFNDAGHMQTTETLAPPINDDSTLTSPGLDIAAKIHLKLCAIKDAMDSDVADRCAAEQARLESLPRRISLSQTGQVTGNTWEVVRFGGPQKGRQWHIRGAVAVALNAELDQPSAAFLCVGPPAGPSFIDPASGPSGAAMIAVRDSLRAQTTTNAPMVGFYSVGQVYVPSGEVVYMAIKPQSVTDVVAGTIMIEDEPVAALRVRGVSIE